MDTKDAIVICDFDGTITKVDCINDFLNRFADKKWLDIEQDWVKGKISTISAMKSQFGLIKNMTEKTLSEFFDSVKIDEFFKDFYTMAKNNDIKVVIVSDGSEFFIKEVLKRHDINDIDVYSNKFEFKNGQFLIDFPYHKDSCKRKSGTCKCSFIKKFKQIYKTVYYVGDGVSDFCPANKVDFLFAKNKLSEYCQKKSIPYINYTDFNEVINNDKFRYRLINR
ncbi:MtnX-like HAD-IB family phosphatase [bacterium]|nr:MtnX-like HAD-IB family phosphatase [bacterium]